jgi:pyridoxine 5-phosphate synthase
MTHLSVNLNKVALVRNARGGGVPDVAEAARIAIAQGCDGLTVHPREDERHATLDDVRRLAALEAVRSGAIELNVEGDPRPELMAVAREVRATQFTVVPVAPGELTTNRGWRSRADEPLLRRTVEYFAGHCRVSAFVDPDPEGVRLAAGVGADAIELHTYEYAAAFHTPRQGEVLALYVEAARVARSLGLRVHAGHDLDLDNLALFLDRIHPEEVSIGHALVSRAILTGLEGVTKEYVELIGRFRAG